MTATSSMEQNNSSEKVIVLQLAKKFPRLLRNPLNFQRIQKSPPLVPILSQMITLAVSIDHYDIILHLHTTLPNGLLLPALPPKILYAFVIFAMLATFPARLVFLDLINKKNR
jgi:hypothetical protein